jgi:hypothetical protein
VVHLDRIRRCALCADFVNAGEADRESAVPACSRCAFTARHQAMRHAYIEQLTDELVDVAGERRVEDALMLALRIEREKLLAEVDDPSVMRAVR